MRRHQLRAAVERTQDARLARADRAADAAERVVRRAWAELLEIMRRGGPWLLIYRQVTDLLGKLAPALIQDLGADLVDLARSAHAEAAAALRPHLPGPLLEADGLPPLFPDPQIVLGEIFAAPSIHELVHIVFAGDWHRRIAAQTRLGQPAVIAALIANGLQQGKTLAQLAREVRPHVQGVQASARRVARTEGMRVAGEMQLHSFEQMGDLVVGYTVHAVRDHATRPEHRARDGFEYFKAPQPGQRGLDEMPRPPLESQRDGYKVAHNCMPAGTVVAGTFTAGLKAWYAGEVVEIETAAGLRLTLTVNHPVFTPDGLIAAGEVKKGDHLVRQVGEHKRFAVAVDEQDRPASIEQVFGAIQKAGSSAVKRATILDLHGDGRNVEGEIEVVWADGKLRPHLDSHATETRSQSGLRRALADQRRLMAGGPGEPSLPGVAHSPPSLVSGGDLLPAARLAERTVLRQFRFGSAAQFDASRYQRSHEAGRAPDATLAKVAARDAEFVGEILERLPGLVALDHVVEVRKFDFSGHVYDLQSPYGWIVANGLFISNCRCYLTPILRDA